MSLKAIRTCNYAQTFVHIHTHIYRFEYIYLFSKMFCEIMFKNNYVYMTTIEFEIEALGL